MFAGFMWSGRSSFFTSNYTSFVIIKYSIYSTASSSSTNLLCLPGVINVDTISFHVRAPFKHWVHSPPYAMSVQSDVQNRNLNQDLS